MRKAAILLALSSLLWALGPLDNSIDAQERPSNIKRNVQKTNWQVFSPDGMGFSIELPGTPYHTKNPDPGPNGVEDKWFLDLFKCSKKVDFYLLDLKGNGPEEKDILSIEVLNVSSCGRPPELFDKEIDGHFLWMGGDNKSIVENNSARTKGRSRREILYNFRQAPQNGGRFLAVDAVDRIYLLSYQTETMNDDTATKAIVDRIFRSFTLIK
jgi:hypothetical protein